MKHNPSLGKANPVSATLLLACLALTVGAWAASVGPTGYTNAFSTRPVATDFSTSSTGIAGVNNTYSTASALDTAVQSVAAGSITAQVTDAGPADPPAKQATAMWTSGGSAYLVTRATGGAATLLMASLVNNTGTNCNVLHLNYQFTVGASQTEEIPGHRVFYSFSLGSNAWTLLPTVSGLNTSQLVSADVALNQTWTNGTALYLLWVDDNAEDSTESAYEIDNFFASAYCANIPLGIALTAPTLGQHFGLGSTISASVTLTGSPTNVSYFVDGVLAVSRDSAPFTPVNLPSQTLGAHTVYATAQDADNTFLTTATNTFSVDVSLSGTLATNTTLYASNSPYTVSGNLTIPASVTLTIEPGVTVQINPGLNITVGGQMLAEGTPTNRIRFTRANPGSGWAKLDFTTSPFESRLAYCDIDGASSRGNITGLGVSLYLANLVFTNSNVQFITVDDSSLILKHSVLPTISSDELIHFWTMPPNGYCLIEGNYFGGTTGYNDIIDLTGGNRPGPIAQFINNIFVGNASDEFLDLDGTDAHIEGNIFMHEHQDGARASSGNAISTGAEGNDQSELTICRNIFYDIDHVLLIKDHGIDVFQNNTVVHVTPNPINTWTNAVINFGEANRGVPGGDGVFVEGNIFHDLGDNRFEVEFTNELMFCELSYNLLPASTGVPGWPGINNLVGFPQFANYLTNNLTPENIRECLALLATSPALRTGPNGLDMGALVQGGASISGTPLGNTTETNLIFRVAGPGIVAYKWKLNDGAWSSEIPLINGYTFTRDYFNPTNGLLPLTNLTNGTYTLQVLGKNSAGIWQGTNYGDGALATNIPAVRSWSVGLEPPRLSAARFDGQAFIFQFAVECGQTYSVVYSDRLDGDALWRKLTDVPAQAAAGQFGVTNAAPPAGTRFYRVITPAQP